MRELTEQEILTWMKQPEARMFRYRIHARALGALSLGAAVLLAFALMAWIWSSWDRDLMLAVLLLVASINLMIWFRLATSIWFVGRNVLGISKDELLLVKGNQGIAIPFRTLREDNIDWHTRPPIASTSVLPLKVAGKTYRIRLLSPYFSLEHFPAFLGLLLERLDEHALTPKDAV